MKNPNLLKDLALLGLVDALDGEVLDGLLLPPLVDGRVLAAADGLVDVVVVHRERLGHGGDARCSSADLRGTEREREMVELCEAREG